LIFVLVKIKDAKNLVEFIQKRAVKGASWVELWLLGNTSRPSGGYIIPENYSCCETQELEVFSTFSCI
jgi:hypothetical protein